MVSVFHFFFVFSLYDWVMCYGKEKKLSLKMNIACNRKSFKCKKINNNYKKELSFWCGFNMITGGVKDSKSLDLIYDLFW